MRDVSIAVVAVLLSVGISYWVSQRSERSIREELQSQRNGLAAVTSGIDGMRGPVIVDVEVRSAGGGRCLSSTDPRREVPRASKVHWPVRRNDPDARRCFANGETVKIVPKAGQVSPLVPPMPFDSRLIKADVSGSAGTYQYEIWLADRAGNNLYMMEDPELEIIEVVKQ
jgi:hypothetical protein